MVKRKSKRQTLKKKYFVQKRVGDFNRKERKKDRENAKKGIRQRTRRDPGIPNICPFKKDLIDDLEKQQQQDLADRERRRDRIREQREIEKSIAKGTYVKPEPPERIKKPKKKKPNFYHEIKKVIEESDVILEVLDSRDPLGSRCYAVEDYIQKEFPHKKIAFVLNKIDLIPKENIKNWLRYLSLSNPTIAFKCSLSDQKKKLGQVMSGSGVHQKISETLGEEVLFDMLRDFRKKLDKPIIVGIIGYPNVGKSSLINSLKRSEYAPVGAMPHFTKTAKVIQLEKDIKVMDSPGVIFSSQLQGPDTIIRNVVDVDAVANTVGPVGEILNRCNHDRLLTLYKLNSFKTPNEFLEQIAVKRSRTGRKKHSSAARLVLVDLITHKVPFYNNPPTVEYDGEAKKKGDLVVKKHLPAFKLLAEVNERLYLPIQSDAPAERAKTQISLESLTEKFNEIVNEDEDEDDEDDEDFECDENDDVEDSEEDDEEMNDDDEEEDDEEEDEVPLKNGKRKTQEKKTDDGNNKKTKKKEKPQVVDEDDEEAGEAGEAYDFAIDFKASNDGEEDEDEEDEEDD